MTPTGSTIRQYLEDRGISARAVAARMGVHPGHLQRVLSGRRGEPRIPEICHADGEEHAGAA